MSCQELRAFFPNSFPEYVMAHTLWNKEISFESLQEEYFSSLYGSCWKEVLEYLKTLSDLNCCDYFNGIGSRINPKIATKLEQAIKFIEPFQKKIESQLSIAKNLEKTAWILLDYHSKYCTLIGKALLYLAKGDTTQAQKAWTAVMYYIRTNEVILQPYLDIYRVIEVATNYTGFVLDMPR